MNKKLVLNIITLVITTFLLIFVINAWYVSNSTATVSNVTGTTANDGFTLDLERGTYNGTSQVDGRTVYNWTWQSTNDLSINNMEPGDAFFFRFKVTPTKNGTYRVSLGNITSSIQKDSNNADIIKQERVGDDYYVTFNSTKLFKMDNATTMNVYGDTSKTDNLGTLYTYASGKFTLDDYKVQDVFRYYNFGKLESDDFGRENVIPSDYTGVALENVSYTYTASNTNQFYVYFALEFNDEASLETYLHLDGTVKTDSNLYLCQLLKIGQFELVLL